MPLTRGSTEVVTQADLTAHETLFRELLHAQEENFKTFVKMFIDSTNHRVDEFMTNTTRELAGLKHSLEYSQADIAQMANDVKALHKSTSVPNHVQEAIETLQTNYTDLEKQVEYIDNYSRRNSLLIKGLPESTNETWADTEVKVRDLVRDKLGLEESAIEIERAHRMGSNSSGDSRQIAIKLLRFKDKEDILANAKKLVNTGIYINQSYSDKVNTKRSQLWQEVKANRRNGKIAYLSFDKLVVKERQPRGQAPWGAGATASPGDGGSQPNVTGTTQDTGHTTS